MAVSPCPPSKLKSSASKNNLKGCRKQQDPTPQQNGAINSLNSCAVESQNGATEPGMSCHQCRQKTQKFAASCTNVHKKPCKVKICFKCLQNRYGESAEDVAASGSWKCPKCRGICNCSICMKKKGQEPTGILVHLAKSGGFSSVSDLLHAQGSETVSAENVGGALLSTKRNAVDENQHPNAVPIAIEDSTKPNKENSGKRQRKKLKVDNCDNIDEMNKDGNNTKATVSFAKIKKKPDVDDRIKSNGKCSKMNEDGGNAKSTDSFANVEKEKPNVGDGVKLPGKNPKKSYPKMRILDETGTANIVFPQGNQLLSVEGIEVSSEDVGLALQFLEFCTAFMKFLDLQKGQAASILRDVICGRRGRHGRFSSSVQFQIKLLSRLNQNAGEDDKLWLMALRDCLSESQFVPKGLPSGFIEGSTGYDTLSPSDKLRVLIFLCDEILDTEDLRIWIDDENGKFIEKHKEAKRKLDATKEKEKAMLKKLRDELANGASHSITEQENILSEIKTEVNKAHLEKLEALRAVTAKKKRSDAVRTQPLYMDGRGRLYWRLKSCSSNEPHILIQEANILDMATHEDKWFYYDDEQGKTAEKCISICKKSKKIRANHVTEQSCSAPGI